MRYLALAAALALASTPALSQPYTTTPYAIICTTERGVTDGINLLAKGERAALGAVGCFPAGGVQVIPLADGIMDTSLSRVILKSPAGTAQGYIYKPSIHDATTGKTVHWSDKPGY